MKTSLIIPDIHHRWKQAEKIIQKINPDQTIFLADYFDDFKDTPDMAEETAKWLVDSVSKPNRIHLVGNHDIAYMYNNRIFGCSGYSDIKNITINSVISGNVWNQLKFHYFLDDTFLLSHAGLHSKNLPDEIKNHYTDRKLFYKKIDDYLNEHYALAFKKAKRNESSWVFGAGRSRGGYYDVGGINWCDFTREMYPIIGLNQIVGHTPRMNGSAEWIIMDSPTSKPHYKIDDGIFVSSEKFNNINSSYNLGLDVFQNTHYAVWNGNELKIGNYNSL